MESLSDEAGGREQGAGDRGHLTPDIRLARGWTGNGKQKLNSRTVETNTLPPLTR